ncbi:hypothetical protein K7A41_01505 [Sphingobacterium sp. InxBP1]|uniref:hypothetical protein n=1 Tax=Sphingobacterium sp. InxBP1 TaxID=2870328 RepID=UPI0022438CCB|nr:hypothetical protein [Sphingobacterium sp. InxBP1]MCW8309892.1 hypothetical protein [Sphingobacterium sp. InxBP1]
MNILLTFLSLCLLGAALYKTIKIQRMELLRRKLVSNYDKIELYILKNKRYLSKEDLLFLNVNKNIAVNPKFLDIEVMIAIQRKMKKNKVKVDSSWYPKYIESNGEDLKKLMDDYYKNQIQITFLSAIKIKYICKFLIFQAKHSLSQTKISVNEILKNKIKNTLYSNKSIPEIGLC